MVERCRLISSTWNSAVTLIIKGGTNTVFLLYTLKKKLRKTAPFPLPPSPLLSLPLPSCSTFSLVLGTKPIALHHTFCHQDIPPPPAQSLKHEILKGLTGHSCALVISRFEHFTLCFKARSYTAQVGLELPLQENGLELLICLLPLECWNNSVNCYTWCLQLRVLYRHDVNLHPQPQ